jgi:hypothetical protein
LLALPHTLFSQTAEDSLSLSAEESRLLGLESLALPSEETVAYPIQDITISGLAPAAEALLTSLFPLRIRQFLTAQELDTKLHAFNKRMSGRTDLFESCVAMSLRANDHWRIRIQARSRTFGSYGGGNAYGYFGNHNRTLAGDQWGAWVGANRAGYHQDWSIHPGLFAGAMIRYDTPMESDAPDHNLHHVRVALVARQFLSSTQSWDLEAGMWAVRTPDASSKIPLVAYTQPAWELDQTWAKTQLGIGSHLRLEALAGQDLSEQKALGRIHGHGIVLTKNWHRLSALAIGDVDQWIQRPTFAPAVTGGFGVRQNLASDPQQTRAATLSLLPRFRVWQRDLWFTGIDAGLHGLLELYASQGKSHHAGLLVGSGMHCGFRPPVGIEFRLAAAWQKQQLYGIRLDTERSF